AVSNARARSLPLAVEPARVGAALGKARSDAGHRCGGPDLSPALLCPDGGRRPRPSRPDPDSGPASAGGGHWTRNRPAWGTRPPRAVGCETLAGLPGPAPYMSKSLTPTRGLPIAPDTEQMPDATRP